MVKNKTLMWVIIIVIGLIAVWQLGLLDMFTLTPVTIDPATCTNPSAYFEKAALSDAIHQPCYPYSWKYPTILVAYDLETGQYINTVSGDSLIWGTPISGGALVRCYKCDSAQVIGNSARTRVLTDDKISNPLGQSQAFAVVCQIGACAGGFECKSNGQGTYYEYNGCNNNPPQQTRFCGNGIVENGETRENCCKDVGCEIGFECKSNQCVEIEEPELPEDCGNGVCDEGENQNNCCTDCRCPGSFQCINNQCIATSYQCGDQVCNAQETCESCPADCGQCECVEGQMEYIDCGEGWKPNIWAIQQCINRHWQPVQSGLACYCVSSSSCLPNYKCSNNVCTLDLPTFCASTRDCGVSGYYCDTTSHKCLACTEEISECELVGFECNSANDCFDVSNNYCASWTCSNRQCMEGSARFEGCCNDISSCGINQTCSDSHVCQDIPIAPKKPVSLLNIIITVIIIGGIGILVWLFSTGKIKLPKIGGK